MHDFLSNSALSQPTSPSDEPWQEIQATNEEILTRLKALQENPADRSKDYYTVAEVAQYVGRSPYTVRRWILDGKINAVRIVGSGDHGRLLVPQNEIPKLFESSDR